MQARTSYLSLVECIANARKSSAFCHLLGKRIFHMFVLVWQLFDLFVIWFLFDLFRRRRNERQQLQKMGGQL
jgi:hypothetical protein